MRLRLTSAVAVLVAGAPAFGVTVLSVNDPSLQGTVIASQTVAVQSLFPGADPAFLVDQKIIQTTAGTLDFYYKVINLPNQSTTLRDFGFEFPAGDSLQLDWGYLDEGNLAPIFGEVITIGVRLDVNDHFGPDGEIVGVSLPASGTDWLVLRSNASAYTIGLVGGDRGQDDQILPAVGFAPDASSVPEPMAVALLPVGMFGLAVKLRRR